MGWDLGALSPGARASLGSQRSPWRTEPASSHHFSFLSQRILSSLLFRLRFGEGNSVSWFSSPARRLPVRERSLAVSITMAGKSVHRNERPSAAAICSPSVPPLPLSFLGAWDLMTSSGLLASALLGKERGL